MVASMVQEMEAVKAFVLELKTAKMLEIWRGLTREIEKDFLMVQLKVPETALQSGSLLVCSMESSTEGMMVGEMVEEMEGPSVSLKTRLSAIPKAI